VLCADCCAPQIDTDTLMKAESAERAARYE
jgi:hypothetical protein